MTALYLEDTIIPNTATTHEREFTVRVPGSTSNLGAGFDCVGLAIGRWLELSARISSNSSPDPVSIVRKGTLATLDCTDSDDLIWRGFVAACAALRRTPPNGVHIEATSNIPIGRGLGSSASAIVAGALLANALFDGALDDAAVIDVAVSLEGHPDNVAPAVLGGAVLSVQSTGHHYHTAAITVHPSLRFVFLVPDFEVRTAVARAALPAQIEFAKAVTAAGRAAALILALQSGDESILRVALDDVLHVPYRRDLIPGYDRVTEAAVVAGAIGATISGSGSTIVAVTREGSADAVSIAALNVWQSAGVKAESFVTRSEQRGATIDTVRKTSSTSQF